MNYDSFDASNKSVVSRAERFLSHALIEVSRFRRLPFAKHSAVLLDLSSSGFKLEFTGETKAIKGKKYWISIPLAPLGVIGPKKFICQCECRWFDSQRFRMGATFCNLGPDNAPILLNILDALREKGFFA